MDVPPERGGEPEGDIEDFVKSESGYVMVIEEGNIAQRYKT